MTDAQTMRQLAELAVEQGKEVLVDAGEEIVVCGQDGLTGTLVVERFFIAAGGVDYQRLDMTPATTQALVELMDQLGGLT